MTTQKILQADFELGLANPKCSGNEINYEPKPSPSVQKNSE